MHMGDAPGIGTAATIRVGTTTVTGGTSGRILYDNAGTLGEMTTTGSGTVVVLATGASLVTPALGVAAATSLAIGGATLGSNALAVTGHLLLEGVTSTGATGTNLLVFATSPTLTTPVLGVATATSLAIGGATLGSNALAVTGHLLLEGVTSTGATGTGNLVFSASPTFTGTLAAATITTSTALSSFGAGQATAAFDTAGALGGAILLGDNTAGAGNGGAVVFAAAAGAWRFAAIKGLVTSGGSNTSGDLVISTRRADADAALTESLRVASSGNVTLATTLATAAPAGSSAGAWKFGALQSGAVVLDTTRSIYVDIGGTVYHLMVST